MTAAPTAPAPPSAPRDEAPWLPHTLAVARGVRRRVLELTLRVGGGYMSQACSAAEILATLYTHILRLGPSEGPPLPPPYAGSPGPQTPGPTNGAAYNGPKGPALDRFVFSPVHYALVLYATLVEVGRLAPEAMLQFNRDGSRMELIGAEHSPGHEVTAGSLGLALSQAGGIALARRLRGETGRTVVFLSDGELQEGQAYEAFASFVHLGLDRVLAVVDVNGQQCDGAAESVLSGEPLARRLEGLGLRVWEVDAHDPLALSAAAEAAPKPGRPTVILAHSDPCRGLDLLRSRAPKLHYLRFRDAAERAAYEAALATLSQP